MQLLSYKASNKLQSTEKDFLGSRNILGGTDLLEAFERMMKPKKESTQKWLMYLYMKRS
jgi:hypothetical protein